MKAHEMPCGPPAGRFREGSVLLGLTCLGLSLMAANRPHCFSAFSPERKFDIFFLFSTGCVLFPPVKSECLFCPVPRLDPGRMRGHRNQREWGILGLALGRPPPDEISGDLHVGSAPERPAPHLLHGGCEDPGSICTLAATDSGRSLVLNETPRRVSGCP